MSLPTSSELMDTDADVSRLNTEKIDEMIKEEKESVYHYQTVPEFDIKLSSSDAKLDVYLIFPDTRGMDYKNGKSEIVLNVLGNKLASYISGVSTNDFDSRLPVLFYEDEIIELGNKFFRDCTSYKDIVKTIFSFVIMRITLSNCLIRLINYDIESRSEICLSEGADLIFYKSNRGKYRGLLSGEFIKKGFGIKRICLKMQPITKPSSHLIHSLCFWNTRGIIGMLDFREEEGIINKVAESLDKKKDDGYVEVDENIVIKSRVLVD